MTTSMTSPYEVAARSRLEDLRRRARKAAALEAPSSSARGGRALQAWRGILQGLPRHARAQPRSKAA